MVMPVTATYLTYFSLIYMMIITVSVLVMVGDAVSCGYKPMCCFRPSS